MLSCVMVQQYDAESQWVFLLLDPLHNPHKATCTCMCVVSEVPGSSPARRTVNSPSSPDSSCSTPLTPA